MCSEPLTPGSFLICSKPRFNGFCCCSSPMALWDVEACSSVKNYLKRQNFGSLDVNKEDVRNPNRL